MIPRTSIHPRGVALLIVLGAIMICVSATATLAVRAAQLALQRSFDEQSRAADDLVHAAEEPIIDWLLHESPRVVLPSDIKAPRIEILHDTWVLAGTDYELQITAWDQCGMVAIELVTHGSPLRLPLSPVVTETFDEADFEQGATIGLDMLATSEAFPHATSSEAARFGPEAPRRMDDPEYAASEPLDASAGATVATHQRDSPRINIHTAPIEIVEAALRLAGRGGLASIVVARDEERMMSLGSLPRRSGLHELAPAIIGVSGLWSFRVDIRVGSVRRSWWLVYERTNREIRSRGVDPRGWEQVQRLVITH